MSEATIFKFTRVELLALLVKMAQALELLGEVVTSSAVQH